MRSIVFEPFTECIVSVITNRIFTWRVAGSTLKADCHVFTHPVFEDEFTHTKQFPHTAIKTNFMEQSLPWPAHSHWAISEMACILSKVNYHDHGNPPLIPILSQVNLIQAFLYLKDYLNIILPLPLGSPSRLLLSDFLIRVNYACHFFRAARASLPYSVQQFILDF